MGGRPNTYLHHNPKTLEDNRFNRDWFRAKEHLLRVLLPNPKEDKQTNWQTRSQTMVIGEQSANKLEILNERTVVFGKKFSNSVAPNI